MDFLNGQIELSSLPKLSDIEWKPIEPDYLKVLRFEWIIFSVIFLLVLTILVFAIPQLSSPVWISVFALSWILICGLYFFLQEKSFRHRAYAVRDHDIMYKRGWITRNISVCPLKRIQHCSVHSGPYERKFSLASLSVFTAGSESADIKISGLNQETAHSIRELIIKKITEDEIGNG